MSKCDLLIGVVKSHKFLWKSNNTDEYIIPINDKIRRRQSTEIEYEEDGSYYIFKYNDFKKNNKIPKSLVSFHINSNNFHVEIDEPNDFEIVKCLSKFLPHIEK